MQITTMRYCYTTVVVLVAKSCPTLGSHGLQPIWLHCPWDFPGKNTRMGCHSLFQGVFLTQGSNPHLLRWQEDSLPTEAPENHTYNSSHVFNHSLIQEYFLRTFKLPGTKCAHYWGYNRVKVDRVPALRKCESKQENQRRKEAINFPLSAVHLSICERLC